MVDLRPSSSPLAHPIALGAVRNATDEDIAAAFYPLLARAIPRLPAGPSVFHGLAFDLAPVRAKRRWILLDGPVSIDLGASGRTSHVVIAHICDVWRDEAGRRPAGIPVGSVIPVGEPLARYVLVDRAGREWSRIIRRRFEINDGIVGWGSNPFVAMSHRAIDVVDWRGPHQALLPGRYAPAGHSSSLTVMPGVWGANQTGVADFVPSPTDEAQYWLHSIALDAAAELKELRFEPVSSHRAGSGVLVAGVTLFDGSADPLTRGPRFQVRIDSGERQKPRVDLGTIFRALSAPVASASAGADAVFGWGTPRAIPTLDTEAAVFADLALSPDARLTLGDWSISAAALTPGAVLRDPTGRTSIEVLPLPRVRVEVEVRDDASNELIPSRVRFTAMDGRYVPPAGHRDEVNPGLYEDNGADLILGSSPYAYVPGAFTIELPVGGVDVEVLNGFDRKPHLDRYEIDPATHRLDIRLERAIPRAHGWVTADAHVHFLAPSTALLQAAAEDVDLVNLLATQWGDLFTNVTDVPWGSSSTPAGDRLVVVGTENRQSMLGHLGLLGAHRPVLPLASSGPPEGRMGGALTDLLADWSDRCRAAGGLVVGAHFPLPYAEIAADIVAGKIDAIETQALAPGLDDPSMVEWYRFLNLGYRLPIVAGTDKMSAEIPVGAVRTYTHLLPAHELTFDAWAAAVRSGRTFVSSGPVLELRVDGREPGDVISLPRSGGRLSCVLRARAAQPVVTDLELVVNGRVVAAIAASGATDLALEQTVQFRAGSWIAARSRSAHEIHSAFATSMAAHTSPIYIEVLDRPLVKSSVDIDVVEQIIGGARAWVAGFAAVHDPRERARMIAFFDSSLSRLRDHVDGVRRS